MTFFVAILGLIFLIAIHEAGHFYIARAVGMRPRKYSVGFGPALLRLRRGEAEYVLGAIPLGGYVDIPGWFPPTSKDFRTGVAPLLRAAPELTSTVAQIEVALDAGEEAEARTLLAELQERAEQVPLSRAERWSVDRSLREVSGALLPHAYWRQPLWKRLSVVMAGPVANILVAFLIFFVVYLVGAPTGSASSEVAAVESNTPAAAAGLEPGDRIVAVNGHATPTFDSVSRRIRASDGREITVTVRRDGRTVTLGPRRTIRSGDRWIWGFQPSVAVVTYPPWSAARRAVADCWQVVTGTAEAIGNLFHGQERGQLTSAVGIVRVSAAVLKVSVAWYLQIVGLVSMSLAILNLLPLLPLDGGRVLFGIVEGIRRRAVAREVYERVSVVGVAIMLMIAVIALSNDLSGAGPR